MKKPMQNLYETALEIERKLAGSNLSPEDADLFSKALEKTELEHFSKLSSRIKAGMTLEQFICFVVPIERYLNNKVTDSEILVETEDVEVSSSKNDLIIVLDNIRSPFNMGAVVRTCDALGVSELLVTGYSPDFDNEKVKKISMGAWKNVNLTKFRDLSQVKKYLSEKKYKSLAVETVVGAGLIHDTDLDSKTALIFGNERFGLSQKDLEICDGVVKLPVFGIKNSLNINGAITACGYEWVRQNG